MQSYAGAGAEQQVTLSSVLEPLRFTYEALAVSSKAGMCLDKAHQDWPVKDPSLWATMINTSAAPCVERLLTW